MELMLSLHVLRNLFLILPVVVIMEVILAQSMQTVGPPYPLHMSYFCSSCGITQSTSLSSIIGSGDNFVPMCLTDHIMAVMAGTSLEFKNAFLNSMVGHALMILSFQLDRHGSIGSIGSTEGSDQGEDGTDTNNNNSLQGTALAEYKTDIEECEKAEKARAQTSPPVIKVKGEGEGEGDPGMSPRHWHLFGYAILLVDSVLELVFMKNIPMKDPSFMLEAQASVRYECNGAEVTEITEEADLLHSMGVRVTVLRCVTASLVILCYHKSHKSARSGGTGSASIKTRDYEMAPVGLQSA